MVSSDNGARNIPRMNELGHYPNGPWRGTKGGVYEAGHRVPFVVRWPEHIRPGGISDETICLTDIMATCAAIVGHDLPKSAAEDSYNIIPALTGVDTGYSLREATVHHSIEGVFAIRQGRWKLIEGQSSGVDFDTDQWGQIRDQCRFLPRRDKKTGQFEDLYFDFGSSKSDSDNETPEVCLFDLESDPGETTNLYKEYPEVVDRLQHLLDRYRDSGRSRE
jgi:arylsulfatase A